EGEKEPAAAASAPPPVAPAEEPPTVVTTVAPVDPAKYQPTDPTVVVPVKPPADPNYRMTYPSVRATPILLPVDPPVGGPGFGAELDALYANAGRPTDS